MRGLILQQRQLYPDAAVMARWVAGHSTVTAEARILWGTEDRVLPLEHAHRLASDLPHAELHLLPGVGHVAQLEVPGVVVEHAIAFLREP
jgi:pimeloyl-ACP methyl ester carboxylesterase